MWFPKIQAGKAIACEMLPEVVLELELGSLVPSSRCLYLASRAKVCQESQKQSPKHSCEVQRKNNDPCHVNSTPKSDVSQNKCIF